MRNHGQVSEQTYMPIGEICNREVIVTQGDSTIQEAAELMRRYHVGDLVVVDEVNGKRIPVGILTDRDIVMEVIAQQVEPAGVTVGDIMSRELVTTRDTSGIFETIQLMRIKEVRRIPIVDHKGGLVGIVSIDDLIEILAEEINDLAKIISREQEREAHTRT